MKQFILLQGGIGDFLQCMPFIKRNQANHLSYVVITHLKEAEKFFNSIGIKPEKIFFFSSLDEQNKILSSLPKENNYIACPRNSYFDESPFEKKELLFKNTKPTIGIQINGSKFSIETQKKIGLISKAIPAELIHKLASPTYNLMIFGLKEELLQLNIPETENLKLVSFKNPADSLAYVSQCDAIIGSDSSIKTMSAMQRIPTFVWLGDYDDGPRDSWFIDPYLKDEIMEVFRYKNIEIDFTNGINKTRKFIEKITSRNPNEIYKSDYGPIIISNNDKGVSSDIIQSGYFEKNQVILINKIIEVLLTKQNKVIFYDVGANIGTHTLAVAKTFPDKVSVRSFEVQRQIFYMLCGTVAINGLRNVYCHNLAISGNSKLIEAHLPNYDEIQNFGGFELKKIDKTDNQNMVKKSCESVSSITLDSFMEDVDFIKMDIEGMEEEALIGGLELLKRCKPVCFIEIFKSNEDNIFKIFKDMGYIGYRTHQDLFALPPDIDIIFSDLPRCF